MLRVSRWKKVRVSVGEAKFVLARQLALAIPAPVSRFGRMGKAWRRRLFRRVTVVRFAVAISAAELERRDSSHGHMDSLQTMTQEDKEVERMST
jgi:hypothetical protein